ncbi:Esterase EstB [Legionella massiliensis]|uniref:Esterase EstB n=1 Tax=Legionella massiliensis TaxID=1034943 RepID=A0A078KZB1_9GAMM|nr:serine hydrolase domain-containing protein [Legionella massiliensis]CDZ77114.1 Esterase EstB [Legionella massiliensis]CEE12852.1 Esterase EstB [Legionella massiliensis]
MASSDKDLTKLLTEEKQAELANIMREADIPGLSAIAINEQGQLSAPLLLGTMGSEEVQENTQFGAASLSKPVFAYLVLKLIESNKAGKAKAGLGQFSQGFDLDTPLCQVFPELLKKFRAEDAEQASQLTARMVLAHTTGLPITHDDSKGLIPFQFKPGTHYGYSGPGIAFLQETLEALTGAKLETLAKEYVFTPCDMTNSTFIPPEQQPELTAQGANSLRTTASDYAKFIWKWISDPAMQYAFEPNKFMVESYLPDDWPVDLKVEDEDKSKLAWGLGLGMQIDEQGKKAFHAGDMSQWRAWVAVDLDRKTALVYFANSHNGHILAEQLISPHIHLGHAFNYFFQTYGFARNLAELEGKTNFHGIQPSRFQPLQLELMREQAKIPGVSIATVSATGELTTETAGLSNKETEQEVNKETIFEAASLSKPVFAYLVLKMAERGELDLDKPLYEQFGDYGPPFDAISKPEQVYEDAEFANNYKKLTPRMILSHQGGLPNEFNPDDSASYCFVSPIGKKFDYSGEAYRFLREVVERIGPPLEILAQQEFAKLGMTHSSFIPPSNSDNQAVGHSATGQVDSNQHFFGIHPGASLYTTAEDYGKFLRACVNDPYIKEQMFKPVVELADKDDKAIKKQVPTTSLQQMSWGLGIGLQKNPDGSMVAFHWGDNNTCRNFAAINLATNQAAVCLTNSANGPALFKTVIEARIGADLSPTCDWLFRREGFCQQENLTTVYKNLLSDLKEEEPVIFGASVNPYSLVPNPLTQ